MLRVFFEEARLNFSPICQAEKYSAESNDVFSKDDVKIFCNDRNNSSNWKTPNILLAIYINGRDYVSRSFQRLLAKYC
jgi:hypothetical protein